MDARSKHPDTRVTPTGAAQQPSHLQMIVGALIEHGVQPVKLNDGDFLTTQGERTETGLVYLVAKGGLNEYGRFDQRRNHTRLTPIETYAPGQFAFLQGLFETGAWGETRIVARTSLIADAHTLVFPVKLNMLKRTLFPITFMRDVYSALCTYHELLLAHCSESDLALLAAEEFFEKREALRRLVREQYRADMAEGRILNLEEQLSLEQTRRELLERHLARLQHGAEGASSDPGETPIFQSEEGAKAVQPEPAFLPGIGSPQDAAPDSPVAMRTDPNGDGPRIEITGEENGDDVSALAAELTEDGDRRTVGFEEGPPLLMRDGQITTLLGVPRRAFLKHPDRSRPAVVVSTKDPHNLKRQP